LERGEGVCLTPLTSVQCSCMFERHSVEPSQQAVPPMPPGNCSSNERRACRPAPGDRAAAAVRGGGAWGVGLRHRQAHHGGGPGHPQGPGPPPLPECGAWQGARGASTPPPTVLPQTNEHPSHRQPLPKSLIVNHEPPPPKSPIPNSYLYSHPQSPIMNHIIDQNQIARRGGAQQLVESLKKGMYGTPDKKRTAFQLGMCGREVGR